METTVLKREINQLVDQLPDELLKDLLAYLQQMEKAPSDKVKLTTQVRRILQEDSELLKRLAQ